MYVMEMMVMVAGGIYSFGGESDLGVCTFFSKKSTQNFYILVCRIARPSISQKWTDQGRAPFYPGVLTAIFSSKLVTNKEQSRKCR